ncbi:MAG: glutamate racemase [Candidatus Marinimicrobia bacterium]|nr:glutamate racemase [Candidatus Neomarinimicrobiota bacterium]MCF7850804.1 glutamate racemase [Candidatus Neomarinimicrobiota bacterium]MCF7905044.1 glutamate racemase [Candidatus Neomarinimicrobiota bacterium]
MTALNSEQAIGIFDSGLGGISVVRALIDLLPHEHLVYFGDTARVPYGSKSNETVIRFSHQISSFLLDQQVKMVVVACNTASSVALRSLQENLDIPVVGVIEPGSMAAVAVSHNKQVGVIGTASTIRSGAYSSAIKAIDPMMNVREQACPLLVPLVEEDWPHDGVVTEVLEEYLKVFARNKPDSLILGCTHYPYLKPAIQRVIGNDVKLVDSGEETAQVVRDVLEKLGLLNDQGSDPGKHRFYVSDFPQKFEETASRFLGRSLENLFKVELEVLESYKHLK